MLQKLVTIGHKATTNPLERLYFDPVETMKNQSLEGSRHFVTLLDEASGYSLVRFFS